MQGQATHETGADAAALACPYGGELTAGIPESEYAKYAQLTPNAVLAAADEFLAELR